MSTGWVLRRLGWLVAAADESLLRMIIYFFYPALILYYTVGNEALKDLKTVAIAPLLGFGTVVFGFALTWYVGGWMGLKVGKGRRSFAFTTGVFNYGYIPIPLIAALFASKETAGVLFVFNVGVEVAMWTIGILLLSGGSVKQFWRKIVNPPVIAITLALLLNFSGLSNQLPSVFTQTLLMAGMCAVPLGLILSGATLVDLLGVGAMRSNLKIALVGISLRLLILPAVFLLLAKTLPGLGDDIRKVLVIQSAMPAAMFTIVIAKHYGGDTGVAVAVVLSTTIIALVTIPLWVVLGMNWVF